MATVYKTPGVYVEEISIFPPSIAQVETAVPAFIGYTRFAQDRGQSLNLVPTPVSSLVEFEQLFGGAPDITVDSITLDNDNNVSDVKLKDGFLLYDSLRLFFANGGSKCYIISIGGIPAAAIDAKEEDFTAGLAVLEKEDEPTLILFPDAVLLANDKLYSLQQAALEQCAKLGDRFAILDLYPKSSALLDLEDTVQDFRDKVGIRNLHYGAAYTPYLRTNLSKTITYRQVKSELERGGVALDLKGLAPADVGKALDQLDNAVSDVDELGKLLPAIAGNPSASVADRLAKLETDFLAAENTFKATPNAGNYAALLEVAFDYVKSLANTPAKNTWRRVVLPHPGAGRDKTKVCPRRHPHLNAERHFLCERQRDWLRSAFTPAALPRVPRQTRSARRSTRRPSMRATGVRSRMPTSGTPATTTRTIRQVWLTPRSTMLESRTCAKAQPRPALSSRGS